MLQHSHSTKVNILWARSGENRLEGYMSEGVMLMTSDNKIVTFCEALIDEPYLKAIYQWLLKRNVDNCSLVLWGALLFPTLVVGYSAQNPFVGYRKCHFSIIHSVWDSEGVIWIYYCPLGHTVPFCSTVRFNRCSVWSLLSLEVRGTYLGSCSKHWPDKSPEQQALLQIALCQVPPPAVLL